MHIAIIPTMSMILASDLIYFIKNLRVKPDELYIIDNSSENNLDRYFTDLFDESVIKVSFGRNIGVNAAWNYGLKLAAEKHTHISILNDDIRIKKDFFERLFYLLSEDIFKSIPVFCPNTTHNLHDFENYKPQGHLKSIVSYMCKREGWAFTIRDSFVGLIPPIPEELFIFFGDDWIWNHTIKYGSKWGKDERSIIYHAVGNTLKKNSNLRALLKQEKRIYNGKINNGSL